MRSHQRLLLTNKRVCCHRLRKSNGLREKMETIIEAHVEILLIRYIEKHVVILNCLYVKK
jgi:hypothetical protein